MKKLRIHYFQHVAHEGLGSIEEWVLSNGHSLSSTRFFENPVLPSLNDIDWLIIMGGPMNTDDERLFPWLADEKKFIRQSIDSGKTTLGICLGSQLISASLGAKVYRNTEKEIGWFDVDFSPAAQSLSLLSGLGNSIKTFHWHGDTFDIPENAVPIASSAATKNQAYIYNGKVLALQFHLEPTLTSLSEMLEGGIEVPEGKYVQTEVQILSNKHLIEENRRILFKILTRLAEK
jgi:GMP synthase-like glutamine amidotransferase